MRERTQRELIVLRTAGVLLFFSAATLIARACPWASTRITDILCWVTVGAFVCFAASWIAFRVTEPGS